MLGSTQDFTSYYKRGGNGWVTRYPYPGPEGPSRVTTQGLDLLRWSIFQCWSFAFTHEG